MCFHRRPSLIHRAAAQLGLALCLVVVAACRPTSGPSPQSITLATTTSTQDSGLLDELVPRFKKQTGIEVKVIAVGSGQALELGRRGDADVLLTHSPAAEEKFIAEGYGVERRAVMHNDFVIVGPPDDPAGLKNATTTAVAAFELLAAGRALFVSRGDDSGTHQKEKQLWKKAHASPTGKWYVEAGTGMAHVLRIADEKRAYTLTDRGTYLAVKPDLAVVNEGDALLRNNYSVMLVNPAKHPATRTAPARQFADFLVAAETQRFIKQFGVAKYGQSLFAPDAE